MIQFLRAVLDFRVVPKDGAWLSIYLFLSVLKYKTTETPKMNIFTLSDFRLSFSYHQEIKRFIFEVTVVLYVIKYSVVPVILPSIIACQDMMLCVMFLSQFMLICARSR
jgi:hypothetical protein